MNAVRALLVPWCIVLALPLLPCPVLAQDGARQETETAPQSQPVTAESIDAKRAELTSELIAAKRNFQSVTAKDAAAPPAHLAKDVALLETIDLLYGQQLAQLQRLEELRTARVRLEADLDALRATGPTEEHLDSFLLLESVRSELNAHTNRNAKLEAARKAAAQALVNARKQSENRQRARRQAKEAFEAADDEECIARLAVALRLAELESRVADGMG